MHVVACSVRCDFKMNSVGLTTELKRELSAFDDKVTKMERSMQLVCI